MPFIHWFVEPKYLSRSEVNESFKHELEAVTNNTLVEVVRQLACLAKYAAWIFDDVAKDIKGIHNRSKLLRTRIDHLENVVSSLNAKKVSVPVGNLTAFSRIKEHYAAEEKVGSEPFSAERRPLCVQLLYNESLLSPVHVMREIDKYREDGCRSSKYFVCTPVFADKQPSVDLEIETRRPISMCVVQEDQNIKDSVATETDGGEYLTESESNILKRLPSPEERTHALSLKYTYSDVPIDVTGSGFRRMASFRRSLVQQVEFFTRKKKKKKKSDRRNTISDTEDIHLAIEKHKKEASSKDSRKRFSMAETLAPYKENAVVKFAYNSLRRSKEHKSIQTGEENSSKSGGKHVVNNSSAKSEEESKANVSKNNEKKFKNKLRSIIPISTLSQAMSVAVKMRDNTTRNAAKEDSGQSSSGNWSASSSTRTSVESEKIQTALSEATRIPSQTSLSRDSALSGQTFPTDDIQSNDSYQSSTSIETGESLNIAKLLNRPCGSDHCKSLKEDNHTGEGTDGTSTTGTLTPLLGRRAFSPYDRQMAFMDDEESSVYSIDTDGYYTSMHTDSGLRSMSSSNKPLDIDENNRVENGNSDNNSTLSSVSSIEQTDNDKTERCNEIQSTGKRPPEPPARHSSLKQPDEILPRVSEEISTSSAISKSANAGEKEGSTPPASESDIENQESFKRKTSINTSRIPSLCIVTPNQSDDEEGSRNLVPNSRSALPEGSSNSQSIGDLYPHRSSSKEKIVSNNVESGFYTVPRNFPRNNSYQEYPNSTHSWPRSLNNNGNAQNKRINSLNFNVDYVTSFAGNKSSTSSTNENILPLSPDSLSSKEFPLIPLKYVQHITVTPGKRDYVTKENCSPCSPVLVGNKQSHIPVSSTGERGSSSATNNEKKTDMVAGKIIYASYKVDKKNENTNRYGAHVTLDHSGHVVQINNSQDFSVDNRVSSNNNIPLPKDSNFSNSVTQNPNLNPLSSNSFNFQNTKGLSKNNFSNVKVTGHILQSPSVNYNSNTLPALKRNDTNRNTHLVDTLKTASTFPRSYSSIKRSQSSVNGSSSSVDSQSSKGSPGSSKSPLPMMPPPMSLISPSVTQVSRRWSFSGLMGSPDYSVPHPNTLMLNSTSDADRTGRFINHRNEQKMSSPYQQLLSESDRQTVPPNNVSNVKQSASSVQRIPNSQSSLHYENNGFPKEPDIPLKPNTVNPPSSSQRHLFSQQSARSTASPVYGRIDNAKINKNNLPSNTANPSPPPPPNRQYRLLQKNQSTAPSLIPQYTLLRTSTPSSATPIARRHLDWSISESPNPAGDVNRNHYNQSLRNENVNYTNKLHKFPENSIHYRNENVNIKNYSNDLGPCTNDKKFSGYANPLELNKQNNLEIGLTNGKLEKSKKSTMSAEELFAIIHQSKKRLNIKNDSDLSSSPISSRSASPALSTSSISSHASNRENGFANSHYTMPGDRRSWSGDFAPTQKNGFNSPGDRRSWAIDRLGPSKPTTMRDFKMLLLQAGRNGTRDESPRRSAVELLKSTAPRKETSNSSVSKTDAHRTARNPLKNQITESLYDSPNNLRNNRQPRSPLIQSPSQFGRGRMRASFHTRTDILSTPILEDNTEDMEEEEEGTFMDYSVNLNSRQNRIAAPCLI